MKRFYVDIEHKPDTFNPIQIGGVIIRPGQDAKTVEYQIHPDCKTYQEMNRGTFQYFLDDFSDINIHDRKDKYLIYAWRNVDLISDTLYSWFIKNDPDHYFGSYFATPVIDLASLAAEALGKLRLSMTNFRLPGVATAFGVVYERERMKAPDYRANVLYQIHCGIQHWITE